MVASLPSFSQALSQSDNVLLQAPVEVRRSGSRRVLFAPAQSAPSSISRFAQFQRNARDGEFAASGIHAEFIACAIAFESIVLPEELRRFLAASRHAAIIDNGPGQPPGKTVSICWTAGDGGMDRRMLDPCTSHVLARVTDHADWDQHLDRFDTLLAATRSRTLRLKGDLGNLCGLLEDAWAWHFQCLLFPSLSHITRECPSAALADSVFVRCSTALPLCRDTAQPDSERDAETAQAGFLDQLFSPTAGTGGGWLIDRLKKIYGRLASRHRAEARNLALQDLATLSAELPGAGRAATLIYGWALHMTARGTPQAFPASPKTILAYLHAVGSMLMLAMEEAEKDPKCEMPAGLDTVYDAVLARSAADERVRAALGAFQAYLDEQFSIAPRPVRSCPEAAVVRTRANLLWPHEAARIRGWLTAQENDNRLALQILVVFELLLDGHIRIGEVFFLLLLNIRIYPGVVELEIVSSRKGPPLKSKAARRVVTITGTHAIEALLRWRARREAEHALPNDLLFGDPLNRRRVYQLGQTYVGLSRLLKLATGDDSASPHMLRHGVSFAVAESLLCARSDADINPIDRIAARMGHASGQTTFRSYFHFPEILLRQAVDAAPKEVRLPYAAVARLTGIAESALRKKVSRAGGGQNAVLDEILRCNVAQLGFPGIADAAAVAEPPALVPVGAPAALSLTAIAAILTDLLNATSTQAVSLRHGVAAEDVGRIASIAAATVRARNSGALPYRHERRVDELAFFQRQQESCMSRRFTAMHQPKYAGLVEYLSRKPHSRIAADAVEAWANGACREYVSIEHPDDCESLVRLFRESGIPLEKILVRIARHPGPEPENGLAGSQAASRIGYPAMMKDIAAVFRMVYGGVPRIESVRPQRGRPNAYLLISSSGHRPAAQPEHAAVSMDGFHELMTALAAFQSLSGPAADTTTGAGGEHA